MFELNLTETLVDLLVIIEEKLFLFLPSLKYNYGFLLRHENKRQGHWKLIVRMNHFTQRQKERRKELFCSRSGRFKHLMLGEKSSSFAVKGRQRKQEQQQ